MTSSPPSPPAPGGDSTEPPLPPESEASTHRWPGLDRPGTTQALGGLALGLIALFSSYDHITLADRTLQLQQQWGIVFIVASVATVVVDAQLASGSRLREAHERQADRDRADQERHQADRERNRATQERNRATQERNRAAEASERQAEGLEFLRQAAVLSARVQLDASDTNRARLQTFLTLIARESPP